MRSGSFEGQTNPAGLYPHAQTTAAYWQALRKHPQDVPHRDRIDPRGLCSALHSVFLAERIGTGLIRLRLSGTSVNTLAGMDMAGLPLTLLFLPEARARLGAALAQVFDGPAEAVLALEAERGIGRPALPARLVLLPLRSDSGACTLLMGCLDSNGPTGRAPRRFAIADCRVTPMAPPAPIPMPRLAAARPHLRLVHSA